MLGPNAMANPTTDSTCIFCKIVAGDIPCHKLHETNDLLAFLDVGPVSRGHTLVIPKSHYATIDQLPDALGAAIGEMLPRVGRAIMQATEADGLNILQNNGEIAGQSVHHVHFHIIPKYDHGDGLGTNWQPKKIDAHDASILLDKIQNVL